ncbi:MAG: glycoside hydrolase family 113 [Jiangellaceae bacterium]
MTAPALRDLHRGVNFGFLARPGYFDSDEARRQVDRMPDMGVRWVALMVTVMQDSFASTRLYQDFDLTPTDHEVEKIIDHIHDRGMHVLLKPVIECHDSAHRARITFPEHDRDIADRETFYWDQWFASLRSSLRHYAGVAQRSGCELLSLGSELQGTDEQTRRWATTVRQVREWYDGPLTYQVNEYWRVRNETHAWLRDLDLLSFSFYYPAARSRRTGESVEGMRAVLEPQVSLLRDLATTYDLAILFNEVGCRSLAGAAVDPGNYRPEGAYDGDEQARYAEAVLSSFWDEPWWRGMYWWKWEEQQDRPQYRTDPAGDTGFTVDGKPAADVLRRWYERTDR